VVPCPAANKLRFALRCTNLRSDFPTRPRWYKESILLTCGDEIGSQRAGNVGAAQAGFNGDEVLS
jgi:hypothetical protein